MRLLTTWFGIFVMDGERTADHILFPREASAIAARLRAVGRGDVLAEERELAGRYRRLDSPEPLVVGERRLAELGDVKGGQALGPAPVDFGFDPELLRQAALLMAEEGMREVRGADWHVMQAVDSMDELTRAMNSTAERLRSWYAPHWPELERIVDDRTYALVVREYGSREDLIASPDDRMAPGVATPGPRTVDPGDGREPSVGGEAGTDLTPIRASAGESVGCEMSGADLEAARSLAAAYGELDDRRESMASYVRGAMEKLAPNLSALAGPLIGARLLRLAGGLERLARLPSSTIQVLGAEKALFSHLREGTLPPKHGIIFQHPLVHSAAWWQRGRISRHFAGKICIAARTDHSGGEARGRDLLEDVARRAEDVKKAMPDPPAGRRAAPPVRRPQGAGPRSKGGARGGGRGRGRSSGRGGGRGPGRGGRQGRGRPGRGRPGRGGGSTG